MMQGFSGYQALQLFKLQAKVFRAQADAAARTASLWETNPAHYGADTASIAQENGHAWAFRSAAEDIERLVKDLEDNR